MREQNLITAVKKYITEYQQYYREWQFDQPITTSVDKINELKKAQACLHKLIKHVGLNFVSKGYFERMPVSDKVIQIVTEFNKKESYELGTYRTDFVFDEELTPKFIEITCQFSLNAFFQSAIFDWYAQEFAAKHSITENAVDYYGSFLPYFASKIGDSYSVCVIKGRDKIQASRFFIPILRDSGLDVKEISYQDIWQNRNLLKKSLVINECMMDEIESMSVDEIQLLTECKLINDYRTIFIAHDKRFISLLNNPKLQEEILTSDERALFNRFLIPTYPFDSDSFDEEDVLCNKDQWILKHINLGRSREIYSGLEFSPTEWKKLLASQERSNFIVQKWVPQQRFHGTVNGTPHHDYLTGTLLYFDQAFFGLGLFRSSSHFITNKVDNRNISPLILENEDDVRRINGMLSF